ncbi:hypothetical protein KKG16_05255 [Patescibacteria group bacterium]|nr:hypothetical protein [Patescibacteria group bacterium]
MTETLFGIILAAIGIVSWQLFKLLKSSEVVDPRLKADLEHKIEEIGKLNNKIDELKSESDELKGKGKQMAAEHFKTQAKNEELSARVAEFQAQQKQRETDQKNALAQFESATKNFEDEKMRVRKEDEERKQMESEARDRMWTEHEATVLSHLTDLCKKPQFNFTYYDNTNLPDGFHGNLKPDFLISFLDQYIVFDAKVSKAANVTIYINDQVKKTAKKVKGKDNIYTTVFLVIPTLALKELKKTSFYEEGFTFYVISPESLEPILASLKRIESYEFAQEMNPQERENIIDLIAQFDFHISTRNTVDFHLLQHGLATLENIRSMDPDLVKEVEVKKCKIRNLNLNTAENKKMVANPQILEERLIELTAPAPKMKKEDLEKMV